MKRLPVIFHGDDMDRSKGTVALLISDKGLSERGIALILVLWIVTILSMAAMSFSLFTRSEAQATLSYKEELEHKFFAEAGLRRAIMELFYRKANGQQQVLLEGFEIFQCDGRTYTGELAEGHYRLMITDESGKINLNGLTDGNGVVLKNILMNNGVADEEATVIVDSILDWKDQDNIHRLSGAEDEYYQSLPQPYKAKNSDFETLEELFLVRGLSASILLGSGAKKGILPYCTIYSKSDKINLNAAPLEVLKAIPGISEAIIDRILLYRDLKPDEKVQLIAGWLGADFNVIAPYATDVESNVYSIDAVGYKDNEKRRYAIHAVVMIEGPQKYRFLNFKSPSLFRS
jgi:general secretion pathway protein K